MTYLTPTYELCLEVCSELRGLTRLSSPRILNPYADRGDWGRATRAVWRDAHLIGLTDKPLPKPEWYDEWLPLSNGLPPHNDLVLGSPPHKQAAAAVREAYTSLSPHTWLAFILSSYFVHEHQALLARVPLRYFYVVPDDIDDEDDDAPCDAVCVWQQEYWGDCGLRWLAVDPAQR